MSSPLIVGSGRAQPNMLGKGRDASERQEAQNLQRTGPLRTISEVITAATTVGYVIAFRERPPIVWDSARQWPCPKLQQSKQLRKNNRRLNPWNHLAQDLFFRLEGDVRVTHDTILVTYYNAPNVEELRRHFEDLPTKLKEQNVAPEVPWLYNYKLDFRFC